MEADNRDAGLTWAKHPPLFGYEAYALQRSGVTIGALAVHPPGEALRWTPTEEPGYWRMGMFTGVTEIGKPAAVYPPVGCWTLNSGLASMLPANPGEWGPLAGVLPPPLRDGLLSFTFPRIPEGDPIIRLPRSMFEASTFSRENATAPEGYKTELVRRPLTAETLPDIRIALAEGRLLFVEAEYSLRDSPPGDPGRVIKAGNFPFDLEELWSAFAATMDAAGYFWERDEHK